MHKIKNPDFIREPKYDYGTKTISTNTGIEYCVEYLSEDKKQTRLLWFKQSGEYIRLNAKPEIEEVLV